MKLGVQKSKECLEAVGELAVDAIALVKSKGFALGKIIEIIADVKVIIACAPEVIPELKDVDASEGSELAAAGLGVVEKIISAIK